MTHTQTWHPDTPTELAKRLSLSSSNFHFTQLPKYFSIRLLLSQNTIFCQFPRLKDTDGYPSQTFKFLNAHTKPNIKQEMFFCPAKRAPLESLKRYLVYHIDFNQHKLTDYTCVFYPHDRGMHIFSLQTFSCSIIATLNYDKPSTTSGLVLVCILTWFNLLVIRISFYVYALSRQTNHYIHMSRSLLSQMQTLLDSILLAPKPWNIGN